MENLSMRDDLKIIANYLHGFKIRDSAVNITSKRIALTGGLQRDITLRKWYSKKNGRDGQKICRIDD